MTKKKISSKSNSPKANHTAKKTLKKTAGKKIAKKIVGSKVKKISQKSKPVSKKISPSVSKKSVVKNNLPKADVKILKKTSSTPVATQTVAPLKRKKNIPSPVPAHQITRGALQQTFVTPPAKKTNLKLDPFLTKQRQRLLHLKDMLLDSMSGVARGNLRAGSDASGFGMHQADAGSDAYDRDFALSILSQEQNSLYEIDEALKRIDDGTYGICEISNKQILRARLEARPFTRYTVECQADLEKRQHVSGTRVPVSALFGITEEESDIEEDENFNDNPKD